MGHGRSARQSRTGPARRRIARWLWVGVLLALLALQVLSLPFYAGSSLGSRLAWRLEHGRMTVTCNPPQNGERFYVAINSEGLRWRWDARFSGVDQWMVCVPLWVPILAAAGCAAWTWRGRAKRTEGSCASCGYPRAGPATCPECGASDASA